MVILSSRWCRRHRGFVPIFVAISYKIQSLSSVVGFHITPSIRKIKEPLLRSRYNRDDCQSFRYHSQFSTECNLFFRKADSGSPLRRRNIDSEELKDLESPEISIPYEINSLEGHGNLTEPSLFIRFMTQQDIKRIMPLCIDEFGMGSTLGLSDFPFQDLRKFSDWWDRVYFEPSVALSLRSKMNANLDGGAVTGFKDPAVLVLVRAIPESKDEQVVGMVELSLQPPDPNKNPPPFPLPLWIKVLYCRLSGTQIQGWVTNLLVDPRLRGLGYAKILMAATEGIAKSWGCEYIYLHADADFRSGKVPQSLYKGLGYDVVTDDSSQFDWMARDSYNPLASIRMIEGVPLLCFRKKI